VSPLLHADRIRVPLFIAHGEADTRVLSSQSKSMVKALQRLGKPVEWLPLENVGHGFFWLRDTTTYHRALLTFLKLHIGKAASTVGPASASATQ
jgi:dipeptidyl aminopeptidase/acylaminoacyl peptidase